MPANTNSGQDDGHDCGPQPGSDPQPETQTEASGTTQAASARRLGHFGLPVMAGATVVAVGVGLMVAVGQPGHSDSPPVLRLIDQSGMLAATAEGRAGDAAARVDSSRFVVSGTLPTRPDRASVYTFASARVPRDRAQALAHALGMSGQAERDAAGWQLRTGDLVLGVSDRPGWPWSLTMSAMAVPDIPTSAPLPAPVETMPAPDGTLPAPVTTLPAPVGTAPTMSCMAIVNGRRLCPPTPLPPESGAPLPGVRIPEHPDRASSTEVPPGTDPGPVAGTVPGAAPGGGSSAPAAGTVVGPDGSVGSVGSVEDPGPLPPTPAPGVIRSAAAPVLAALGLTDTTVTVTTSPGSGLVRADPVVDGLPTDGYPTALHFDGAARLTFANGWLATPRQGARYSLATAGDTLEDMDLPVPAMMCDPCPPTTGPATITGARLGLALRHDDQDRPLLVPAWFYRLDGSDQPLVLIAVEPRFLGGPRDTPGVSTGPAGAPADSGSGGSGSADGSAGNGSAGQPGAPVQVAPPAPPATEAGSVEPAEPAPGASR